MRSLGLLFLLALGCGSETKPSDPRDIPDAGTDAPDAPDAPRAPCMAAAEGVTINAATLQDEDGYAPYAVDGCRLVYVSALDGEHAGALVLRDLADGSEEILANAEQVPGRPSVAGELVTWEERPAGVPPVVRVRSPGGTTALSGDFLYAVEPRAASDAVVFTGFMAPDESDTDVFVYSAQTGEVTLVAGGFGQQRFADISETHIAVSDFSEDATGVYDPLGLADADIIVFDRATGESVTRPVPGKQAYPMLGADGRLAFLEWTGAERPVPKLAGYTIRMVELDRVLAEAAFVGSVGTDPPAIRPTARGELIEWVEYTGTQATLYRARADLSMPKLVVAGLDGLDLFAPQATLDFTVLASRRLDEITRLRTVQR